MENQGHITGLRATQIADPGIGSGRNLDGVNAAAVIGDIRVRPIAVLLDDRAVGNKQGVINQERSRLDLGIADPVAAHL